MIEYPKSMAMTGNSKRFLPAQERGRTVRGPLGNAQGAREPRPGNRAPAAPVTGIECGAGKGSEFRWNHGQKEVWSKGLRGSLDRSEGERRAARRPEDQPESEGKRPSASPLRNMTALFALSRKAWGVCAS